MDPANAKIGLRRASVDDKRYQPFVARQDWSTISSSLGLSGRESEISYLILENLSEDAIATKLGISSHTVHSHLERLYRKLEIGSRSELVIKLFRAYIEIYSVKQAYLESRTNP